MIATVQTKLKVLIKVFNRFCSNPVGFQNRVHGRDNLNIRPMPYSEKQSLND